MSNKKRWSWKHQDFISSKWVKKGELQPCPKCSLPLTEVVETKQRTLYYHAKELRCEVIK